jgi:hypothetical protein
MVLLSKPLDPEQVRTIRTDHTLSDRLAAYLYSIPVEEIVWLRSERSFASYPLEESDRIAWEFMVREQA